MKRQILASGALIAASLLLAACGNATADPTADATADDLLSGPFGELVELQCVDTGDVQTSGSWGVETMGDTSSPGYSTPEEALAEMGIDAYDWGKLGPEEVSYTLAWGDGAEVQVLATNLRTGNITSGMATRTEKGGWYIAEQSGCVAGTVTK